jgi:transcriptional regulator GlxA family with amidase domain
LKQRRRAGWLCGWAISLGRNCQEIVIDATRGSALGWWLMQLTRRMVFVAFPGLQALDVVGPAEVFSVATRLRPEAGYQVTIASVDGKPVESSSGLRLVPDMTLTSVRPPIDTLVVPGGVGVEIAATDVALSRQVRRLATGARRVASVCTGAFLLGAAGLLRGRKVTTHWAAAQLLSASFPEAAVEDDRLYVRDGHIWSSAGVTAGVDLALELVAVDEDRKLALEVARWLVVHLHRTGGQRQFSDQLLLTASSPDSAVRELLRWIERHPAADLNVAALAKRSAISERTLHRVFRREVGMTPAEAVERFRVEAARRLLEQTDLPIGEVARRCGLSVVETFYRAFRTQLGVTPAAYRRTVRARPA